MGEVIVVDLGGTHLRVGIVSGKKISYATKMKTPKTKKQILEALSYGIEKCMNPRVKGIGVASAGVIENGRIMASPNMPMKNVNLKKYLERKFKKRVVVENDSNCVALAEMKFGVKRKNFIVLTLGTGIGGGIVIDGRLYRGLSGAGEFGHTLIDNGKDFEYWFQKTKKNRGKVTDYIGQGIAGLISVFDPEVVVIAGGLTNLGESFLNQIKEKTKKYMFLPKMPEIKFSKIDNPGMVGAGLLFD